MRVVYIVSLFPCWSETFIVREIRELMRLGADVRVISLKHPTERMVQTDAAALLDRVIYPASLLRNAIRVFIEIATRPLASMRALAQIAWNLMRYPTSLVKSLLVWWRAMGLLPVLQEIGPAHLHAHWATYPSTAALVLSRRLGIPFSFTSHAHDIFLEHHLLEAKLREASLSVTISQYNRNYLGRCLSGAERAPVQVVHCGVSLDDFDFRPQDRESALLLAVGRLDEIKGFRHLVDACSALARRGHNFTCFIVGDGPLRSSLEKRISELGLDARVRLCGVMRQEEVRRLLYKATAFVLPSVRTARGDMDGIPVALMEAMAAGAPVVSTTVSGIPELVENGVTGLLVPPTDSSALAQSIERLLGDPPYARELAQNARARIEQDFDASKEARKLYAFFRECHGATAS
jgi:glycosyltransferase involved in cell wall biosynthesis